MEKLNIYLSELASLFGYKYDEIFFEYLKSISIPNATICGKEVKLGDGSWECKDCELVTCTLYCNDCKEGYFRNEEVESLSNRLITMESDFDQALKSLGNMYEDEVRAREQLSEIQEFLKTSKKEMRNYKLPVIGDNYFVQLSEANDAINEVKKELDRKPIVIKTLNTRVDTARDLVLKLYNTTTDMIRTAQMAEKAIVYINRYRSSYADVDKGLSDAEEYFYKGNYKESLDMAIKVTSLIDENMYRKLMKVYEK